MTYPSQPGRLLACAALLLPAAAAAHAQYATKVGQAEPARRLRATAVLEYTGTLDKPNASRLVPVAVWDGEHFQPGGLYLAHPEPLALQNGTEYELLRDGEPAGLWDVRGASEINEDWVGIGHFHPEAAPPPPPKLKALKKQPAIAGAKPSASGTQSSDSADGDRPTLHHRADSGTSSTASSGSTSAGGTASSSSSSTPAAGGASSDPNAPTLHRRDSSDASQSGSSAPASTSSSPSSGAGSQSDPNAPTLHRRDSSDSTASSGDSTQSDPDRPTLHRSDTSTASAPDADPDRPTLHKRASDTAAASSEPDPDRPTLHRSHSGSSDSGTASVDPDRPHLRYGRPAESETSLKPVALEGRPPKMEQLVAVSDVKPDADPRPYRYAWPSPDDAAKAQAALAVLAAQALAPAKLAAAGKTATARTVHKPSSPAPASPSLVGADLRAYELAFSAGPTLVYTAHTAADGPARVWITLVAQPDFYGNQQVILKQIARGDRLDQAPIYIPVDAVDADGDGQAELLFELDNTAPGIDPAVRQFALYRIGGGTAKLAFTSGPLP